VRLGSKKPSHSPYRATSGACLVRARRTQHEVAKRRAPLDCNVQPVKTGDGVTRGRLQAEQVMNRSSPAGSLAAESIPIFWTASPFAGWRQNEGLGWLTRSKGTPTLRILRADDHGVLEESLRRGAFVHPAMRRRMGGEGRSFARGSSAHAKHCHRFNQPSPQAATGSARRPQATYRRAVTLGARTIRRACNAVRRVSLALV